MSNFEAKPYQNFMKKVTLLLVLSLVLSSSFSYAQSKKKKKQQEEEAAKALALKNAEANKNKDKKIKDYNQVITKGAKSDDGLFKTHQVADKHYFEIPNKLLGKEMLLVSRIAKLPSNLGGGYVNAGSSANEQLIAWERFQDKILIKVK